MKLKILATKFIAYILILSALGWVLFNYLLSYQSEIMYGYFVEQPISYNVQRARRISESIRESFRQEIKTPTKKNISAFISRYNALPFLTVDFLFEGEDGLLKSATNSLREHDVLSASYSYPIHYDGKELGTLLIYDVNEAYLEGYEKYKQLLMFTRVVFGFMLLLLISIMMFREYNTKIKHEKKLAQHEAVHDGLTEVFTQTHFKNCLDKEISRAKRYKRSLSLIMCDIDHFKEYNDKYGHLAGDNALKKVAGIIKKNVRETDLVARYGGEEFAILLIEAGPKEAESVAKRIKTLTNETVKLAYRIKDNIEATNFPVHNTRTNLTISVGISSYDGHENYKKDYLISEADLALYESKNNGRNLVTLYNTYTKKFTSFS